MEAKIEEEMEKRMEMQMEKNHQYCGNTKNDESGEGLEASVIVAEAVKIWTSEKGDEV